MNKMEKSKYYLRTELQQGIEIRGTRVDLLTIALMGPIKTRTYEYDDGYIASAKTTPTSKLTYCLTNILEEESTDRWNERQYAVPTELAEYIKLMLMNKEKYEYWRSLKEVLDNEGKEVALKWIKDNMSLLKLIEKVNNV